MRRRDFIKVIGGAAAAWPLAVRAQQPNGVRRLGVLMSSANDSEGQARAAAIVQGLGEYNWKEGVNLRMDWRWAGGDPALFDRYATELVSLGSEVLYAVASESVEALRRQRSMIPIVFAGVIDPVGQGFVESLARPGGDITGFSLYDPPMVGKWLGMLTQISPRVARVAVLFNPTTAPYADLMLRAIESLAASFAVVVRAVPVRDNSQIEAMMIGLAREGHGGLMVLPDPFNTVHRDTIVALSARHRLPAVYPFRVFTADGGLMSYSVDLNDLYRRSASYVDRILNGARPADLPVQAPTKFDLVLNLKTAKPLGITFAPSLLGTADELIE